MSSDNASVTASNNPDLDTNVELPVDASSFVRARRPIAIEKKGAVVIKIYRVESKKASGGVGYKFSCPRPGGGKPLQVSRTNFGDIKKEAERVAKLLSQGFTEHVKATDISELVAVR